jgi:molybdate transport system regulatory protein
MHLAVKVFLEKNDQFVVGPGRIKMLQAIGELGSLRKAAEEAGMSYRWAWGRMKKSEEALGIELFDRQADQHSGGRPMVLSKDAEDIIHWFDRVEEEITATLRRLEKDMPECLVKAPGSPPQEGAPKKRQPLD